MTVLQVEKLMHKDSEEISVITMISKVEEGLTPTQPRSSVAVFVFETWFLCSFGACSGTHFVDQAGLELTEFLLPLPPECWN